MTPAELIQQARKQPPYKRLKAYVVSDVHLNNHPYDRQTEKENPRRKNFRVFLSRINAEMEPNDKVLLILNGDILDITGSWFDDVMPWDSDDGQVQTILHKLLLEILENNRAVCDEIRRLIKHPFAEVVYVYGNHDGLLQKYPSTHQLIREFLSENPHEQNRISFVESFASDELDLYIEHGHLLDPFNHTVIFDPPLGDVINILVVNRFVDLVLDRLRENGYSEAFIHALHTRLHDIEYLRPVALVPVWVQTMATHYQNHPENIGKQKSVGVILIEVISEILYDPKMTQLITKRLHMPKAFLTLLIKTTLRLPAILPIISFFTSKVVRKTHSNKYQYRTAKKMHAEKAYRLIAFGHTHIPDVQPLSKSAYYFNTGSWKPVINLFKQPLDPVDLEYLNPDVQFNKVERCGILCIEKTDFTGRTPTEFSLQTIQSGLS